MSLRNHYLSRYPCVFPAMTDPPVTAFDEVVCDLLPGLH